MDDGSGSFHTYQFLSGDGQARGTKNEWTYCHKCEQHGHFMRDCEKVHQQLAQALANELAQRVVLVAESPNGASSSKKERVANKEDPWVYCLTCQQNGHLMQPDCKNARRQTEQADGDEKMEC